ncbi:MULTISPECIES: CocE/NonD family hydrolase [unclassified Leisingera]|uniref:CocE/NonD family hydrolase n=1 Tax=unclassified Leisingera TaxID=2614906 RepID=UPI0002F6EC17|nr:MULTISPECIES: CocE/NonD family hydrolase [unclassified Leisingera]KIC16555.1 glutaryl 7-ACA acylase [Leisingera sp. ANG-DT]KIC24713.1 glutaryl 7-ACA acylase [Leisingera sp. ANG-S3]KIC28507.1 glutaryl 7-ACA acylase [Leisingera sp. ANG-M6]KIC55431.1 glutaryl 7-ACA acylase [Leisingera sp. ANG-S]KID09163.1 glutaryl 7-ACA acylase [Leisingera sp. ANG1]
MPGAYRIIENNWITLPDGRKLAARMWLPKGEGPFPAILEYLPYRKRDGTAPRDETTHTVFAAEGYACVRVDIAGTGDSEGVFDDEYSEQELSDGETLLEWIASQDWCDGKIGMIGISWGGFNGLQLAFRRPAALKAVVSVASTVDRYADDIHYMGGCLLSDNANWGSQMFAYQSRPADPELRSDWRDDWIKRIEGMPFMAAEWLRQQVRGDFWKHGSVCEEWSAIQAPVLAITGWADAYVNAPPALAANLTVPAKAMIGPWEHRYAHIAKLDPADFHGEVLRWFGKWLKGEETGAEELPDYRVYMQEHFNPTMQNKPRQGRWVAEAAWPSPNVQDRVMHLGAGVLAEAAASGALAVRSPATVGQAGGYFCPGMRFDNELAGDQAEDDKLSACFDTAPLEETLEVLGRPRVKVAFSVDKPVAQLVARLCDVSPEGVSQRISFRPLNLTCRKGFEAPEKLVPGKRYEAEIELNECAHRLKPGHQLRLALSTSYWPIVWPAPEAAEVNLHLEGCQLVLPERRVSEEIDPQEPGAPRDYPVLQAEQQRKASGTSKTWTREDGVLVLDTFDDYGKAVDPYHGMCVGSHVTMHYEVHPDDPATAAFASDWSFEFERNGWHVSIDTENRMTCDRANFYLWRRVTAYEGAKKEEVVTKEWREVIPRGVL